MTFVYPLLLGGLLLAGAPVLLHFLVRQKPKTLLFPAFRFLLQKQRSNTRNLRLRHLLLLLLRIALLLLICFALARPRLFHDIGFSREKPVAMIVVFDTSPSMGYKSGDTTRLELAKQRCIELLDQLPEDGRVLILDAADPTSFAREDWLKSLEKARQRVSTLAIRPDNAPVTKALAEAWRRFDELDRSSDDPGAPNLPRFVCIFSDRTRASWDSLATPQREKADAATVQMLYFDVGVDDPIDLAILSATFPGDRASCTEGETIRLRVLVKATGKDVTNTLILSVDDKKRAMQALPSAEAGKAQTLMFDIDTRGLGTGMHQAEVKFEAGDALSFNDARFVTFEIQAKQKILVLADNEEGPKTFKQALEACGYDAKLATASAKPDLAGYHAVFLVGVKAPTDPLWLALADYVQQGNGVGIVPPGDDIVEMTYKSPAAKKVMPAEFIQKINKKIDSLGASWSAEAMHLDHSFQSPYRRWLAQGNADFLKRPRRAFSYWEVKPPDQKDVAAFYDDLDRPAVVERVAGGKVLLLTTTMDERKPAWNDYDENPASFYVALTMMCAKHLCPEPANLKLNYQFGQEPPLLKPGALAFKKYALSNGDFTAEISFVDGRWIGEHLPRQGNYTITGTTGDRIEVTHRFSINIASAESDLTRVPAAEIEALLGKDALVPQDRRIPLPETLNWNEPMELFPWLMILLLFLLAIENLLANRFYRQEPAETKG